MPKDGHRKPPPGLNWLSKSEEQPLRPSQADELTRFDRFATAVSSRVARAWFFALCVVVVLVWAPTFVFFTVDIYQLLINTFTTIVTFLLVALLQNTQSRDSKAIHRKLNAIAEGLADLMEAHQRDDDTLRTDLEELRQSVGLEHREGT